MELICVQKYGGSSLVNPDALRQVAGKVAATRRQGWNVVVVVSAMGGSTDSLVSQARAVVANPDPRELDVLLTTGEQTTTALLTMALKEMDEEAVSLTGSQCGIRTNAVYGNARIVEILPGRVLKELEGGRIVVVAGFQGATDSGEVTTLGRGGSDTTAVALAAALKAEKCDIYTDVEGIWSADPRVVEAARPIEVLHHDDMEAMGWHGARVLKAEAAEFARDHGIRIRILSSFGGEHETRIDSSSEAIEARSWRPGKATAASVTGRKDLIRLTIAGDLDQESRKRVVEAIARYDLIFGYLKPASRGRNELYLSTEEMPGVDHSRAEMAQRFGDRVHVSEQLGAVSLLGFGIGSRPSDFFEALQSIQEHDIHVVEAFTDREALSFVVPVEQVDRGMRVLHEAFVERPVASLEDLGVQLLLNEPAGPT